MQTESAKPQIAIKPECMVGCIGQLIAQLEAQKKVVAAELGSMPVSEWQTKRCRDLGNREHELHVTLGELERIRQNPKRLQTTTF